MSIDKKLVSILIPVYNREHLIIPCIESALSQTYKNIEIIIVDNNSTDGTWNICKEYAKNYECIKVFRNEHNLGPVLNWNECIKHANGEFAKILFSDDLIYETYLEETVPHLTDNVGFVFARMEIGSDRGCARPEYKYKDDNGVVDSGTYCRKVIFREFDLVSPGAALFRLADLRKNLIVTEESILSPSIKDFNRHGAGPDLLIYLLTCVDYEHIYYVDKVLGLFRSHSGSITIADSKKENYLYKCYMQARIFFCERYSPINTNKLLSKIWWKEARKKYISFKTVCDQYTFMSDMYSIDYIYLVNQSKFILKLRKLFGVR